MLVVALWVTIRLVTLQIIHHDSYAAMASTSHELNKKINADRGKIFFQDSRTNDIFPAAVTRDYYEVYVVPRQIPPAEMVSTSKWLGETLGLLAEDEKVDVLGRVSKSTSYYQNIAHKVAEDVAQKIQDARLPGVFVAPEEYRFYPEGRLASAVLGFCARDNRQLGACQYGIEGYWNKELSGKLGFVAGEKSAGGNWITLAGRTVVPAEEGVDLVLTIDRTLQYEACKRLEDGLKTYGATNASLVMLQPKTGAILAMCNFPDFDPNEYGKVSSTAFFNNATIFTPYEPGSVFKPVTMAAAIDLNLVTPSTTFVDPCKRTFGPFTVYNALRRCYGTVTMTEVLQNSINTGVVWLSEKIGPEPFKKYIDHFGFGQKTGVALAVEAAGVIPTLTAKYTANAAYVSFGQSLTATPLQLALAYGAIANNGKLMKPMIVKERRFTDGSSQVEKPYIIDQIISERSSKILTGMLVATLDNYKKTARLEHYYVAGKTGTAQIASKGGYQVDGSTNHTLVGFGPAADPQVVLVVKYGDMNASSTYRWAESTTGPVFKDIMKFVFDYYQIQPDR
jgi:cell division protein FtsI/penicillin-binding protein 2